MGEYTQRLRQLLTQGGLTALDARDGMVAAYLVISRLNQLQGNPDVGLKQDEAGLQQHLSGFLGAIFWERGYNYDHPTVEQLSEIKMMMDGIAQVYAMPDNLQMAVNEINDFLLARAANQPAVISPSVMDLLEYQGEPDVMAPQTETEDVPSARPQSQPDDDLMPEPKSEPEISEPVSAEAPAAERDLDVAEPAKPVLDPELVALFDEAMKEETVPAAPAEESPVEEPAVPVEEPITYAAEESAVPVEEPITYAAEEPAVPAEEPVTYAVEEPASPVEEPATYAAEEPVIKEPVADEPVGLASDEPEGHAVFEPFAETEVVPDAMVFRERVELEPDLAAERVSSELGSQAEETPEAPSLESAAQASAPQSLEGESLPVKKKRVRKKALTSSDSGQDVPKKKGKPGRKPKNAASIVVPESYMAPGTSGSDESENISSSVEENQVPAESTGSGLPEEHLTWDTVGSMPPTEQVLSTDNTWETPTPPSEETFSSGSTAETPEAPEATGASYTLPEAAPEPEPETESVSVPSESEPAWKPAAAYSEAAAKAPSKPRIEFESARAPEPERFSRPEAEDESVEPVRVKTAWGMPLVIGLLVGTALGAVAAWMVAKQMGDSREAQLQTSFEKQIEAGKAEVANAKSENEKLQNQLKTIEAAWRKAPDKVAFKKVGPGVLLYWPNEGMTRKYFLYRGKGEAGIMAKVNEAPVELNFMYFSKPETGSWRFSVSAITPDGLETDKSEAVPVRFPMR